MGPRRRVAEVGAFRERLRRLAGRLPRPLGRPLFVRSAPGVWLIVLAGLAWGYAFYAPHVVEAISLRPLEFEPTGSHNLNFEVYYAAADAALAGENFYDAPPDGRGDEYVYLYPPITLAAFVPFTLVDAWTAYLLGTAATVLASAVAAWAVVAYVEDHGRRLGWIDGALVFAFFVGSIYSAGTVVFGNVNLWLAALVAVGFLALLRGYQVVAGAAFAVAALFKLFPALFGAWLLRTRSDEGVAAALLVGTGGLLAGAVLFGLDRTEYYFVEVVAGRTEREAFVGGYPPGALNYVTAQRPASWLVWTVSPDASTAWLYVATAAGLLAVLAVFYADLSRPMDRHAAILATTVVAVVALPALRWYLVLAYLPILVCAYCWDGPGYRLFVAGGVLFSMTVHPRDVHAFFVAPGTDVAVLDAVLGALSPAFGLFAPLAVLGSPQLWGIALMLSACTIEKRRAGTGPVVALRRWRAGERPPPWLDAAATPPYGPDDRGAGDDRGK